MKKYNSIDELEKAQLKQKENYNRAVVHAMTDAELQFLYNEIDTELTHRALDNLKVG